MKNILKSLELIFLGAALYFVRVASTILSMILTSAIVGVFVMAALGFVSSRSDGAVPALGYFASLGVSFILIFTSYVGARGAAQSKV
jgi:hypothetical protein